MNVGRKTRDLPGIFLVARQIPQPDAEPPDSPSASLETALHSLPEAHRTVPFNAGASWLRKVWAFAGPGYLVAVGYMDPGNWATDIGGGSKFGYTLLSVIVLSNLMAMFLQALSAKLGIKAVYDLSATPFYLKGSGYPEGTLFPWVVCVESSR